MNYREIVKILASTEANNFTSEEQHWEFIAWLRVEARKAVEVPEPIWLREPTWYIHRLLEAWGLQSEDGWDGAYWDEETVISALEDVIKHIMEPQNFIRSMRTLIKEDYEESIQNHIRADANADAEADYLAMHGYEHDFDEGDFSEDNE